VTAAELAGLAARLQAQLAIVRARTSQALATAWDTLDSYDEADIDRYARRVAPAVTAGKAAGVRLGIGFISLVLATRSPAIRTDAVPVTFDPRDPFLPYWHALKEGRAWPDALASGRARAENDGSDLVVNAARQASGIAAPAHGRWQRIPNAGACEWCLEAATKTFVSADAATFGHAACGCVIAPA